MTSSAAHDHMLHLLLLEYSKAIKFLQIPYPNSNYFLHYLHPSARNRSKHPVKYLTAAEVSPIMTVVSASGQSVAHFHRCLPKIEFCRSDQSHKVSPEMLPQVLNYLQPARR